MKFCHNCNDTKDLTAWRHPVSGEEYAFCSYCYRFVTGICAECSGILLKLEPIGVNNNGERICYKCSAAHDMALGDSE